jgi:hypothetical protein
MRRAATLATMLPSKPIPISDILIKLGSPLKPGAQYRLESRDLHNLMGVAAVSVRTFDVPKPQPPPPPPKNGAAPLSGQPAPPAARRDSARADSARADSARTHPAVPSPDTTRKQPPT